MIAVVIPEHVRGSSRVRNGPYGIKSIGIRGIAILREIGSELLIELERNSPSKAASNRIARRVLRSAGLCCLETVSVADQRKAQCEAALLGQRVERNMD